MFSGSKEYKVVHTLELASYPAVNPLESFEAVPKAAVKFPQSLGKVNVPLDTLIKTGIKKLYDISVAIPYKAVGVVPIYSSPNTIG